MQSSSNELSTPVSVGIKGKEIEKFNTYTLNFVISVENAGCY